MPGLIACTRRWNIGSDDLYLPASVEIGLRSLWLVAVSSLFWSHKRHEDCIGSNNLHIYLIGLQAWLFLVILLNSIIVAVSTRGTIVQTRPRKHMAKLLYVRGLLYVIEIGWNTLGTLWAFRADEAYCESFEVTLLVQITAVCSWGILAFILFGVWMVFDPLGSRKENDDSRLERRANKVWAKRLSVLCCCTCFSRKSKLAYSEAAIIFAAYFHDVDFVPSDIAAALILLQEKLLRSNNNQGLQPINLHFENEISSSANHETSNVLQQSESQKGRPDWMTVSNACHFVRYAWGIYGWPLFLFNNLCSKPCRIWKDIQCLSCLHSKPEFLKGDNCCRCNLAALKQMAHIDNEDIIYISFHNEIYETPFYVALDHDTKSVVISIRGSLSLKDALTDLTADLEPLTSEGCPSSSFCHRGMLRATGFVEQKLIESGALTEAFGKCPDYDLVLTGHSLGAGVAVLLAMNMRCSYPRLKCFAFSPSAGMMTEEAAAFTQDLVMSVIFGDDLVGRLNIHSLEKLKKDLVHCLVECDDPKYKVFSQGCWSVLTGKPKLNVIPGSSDASRDPSPSNSLNARPLLNPLGPSPPCSPVRDDLTQLSITLNLAKSSPRALQTTRPQFYVPGSILYIRRTMASYRAKWVKAETFGEIVISTSMITDHLPDRIQEALSHINDEHIT